MEPADGFLHQAYRATARYLQQNGLFARLVRIQHRHAPLPVPVFDLLFRNRILSRLLAPYGLHAFLTDYEARESDEAYWTGRRCLYWHLYRQNDLLRDSLRDVANQVEIRGILSRGDLNFLVPGFGLGKNKREMIASGLLRFRNFYPCELNPFLCEYVRKRFGLAVRCAGLRDLALNAPDFDVLLIVGKVLMVTSAADMKLFAASLRQRGCRSVIVIGEGSPFGDVKLWDNTIQYDLKSWLKPVYPEARFIEKTAPNGFYEYFAMVLEERPSVERSARQRQTYE